MKRRSRPKAAVRLVSELAAKPPLSNDTSISMSGDTNTSESVSLVQNCDGTAPAVTNVIALMDSTRGSAGRRVRIVIDARQVLMLHTTLRLTRQERCLPGFLPE
jgi:predicted ATP-dependent serine protease